MWVSSQIQQMASTNTKDGCQIYFKPWKVYFKENSLLKYGLKHGLYGLIVMKMHKMIQLWYFTTWLFAKDDDRMTNLASITIHPFFNPQNIVRMGKSMTSPFCKTFFTFLSMPLSLVLLQHPSFLAHLHFWLYKSKEMRWGSLFILNLESMHTFNLFWDIYLRSSYHIYNGFIQTHTKIGVVLTDSLWIYIQIDTMKCRRRRWNWRERLRDGYFQSNIPFQIRRKRRDNFCGVVCVGFPLEVCQ